MNSISNTESAKNIGYDNSESGLTSTDVQGAVDELATTPRGYKVIATFTGDGVKTYGDAITELLPYINQADMLRDASNVFYSRNNVAYFSVNTSNSGNIVIYGIRFDVDNPFWKSISVVSGSEVNYISTAVPSDRKIQLCKKL